MKSLLVLVVFAAAPVAADPVASSEQPTPTPAEPTPRPPVPAAAPPAEPTAADVAAAPEPGDESGRTDEPDHDSPMRTAARGLLFFPKLVIAAALTPIRALVWAEDRYQLDDRYYSLFFSHNKTVGLFPTVTYESGYGLAVGAQFVDTNVAGEHEKLALAASTGRLYGETYRDGFAMSVRSGTRFRPVELGVDADLARRPADPFYGVGNDTPALEATYRYQEMRLATQAELNAGGGVHVRGLGALTDLDFSDSTTGPPIQSVVPPSELSGFMTGVRHLYGEVEVRWDSRRRGTRFDPHGEHSDGSLALVYGGRVHRLDGGVDYWHYGSEVQHYWRIANGPRVLIARAHLEAVTGSTTDVPFAELPMLGGGELLRGYDFGRFRDRVAALGTVEYVWDLAHLIDAEAFVDAGRVYDSIDTMTLAGMRVGYGVGVMIHSDSGFLVETSVASSIDGGFVLSVSFNPVLDARPRWR